MDEPEQLSPTVTGADAAPTPPASTSAAAPPGSSSESEQQLHVGSAELGLDAAGNAGGGSGTSLAAAAGDARTSPPSSSNRVAGVIAASGLRSASPPPRVKEQNAASASNARNGPDLGNLDSALALPGLNGGVAVVEDEVGTGFDDVNGGSAPTNSSSPGSIPAPPAPSQRLDEHAASKSAEGDDVNLPEVAVGDAPTSPASPASPSHVAGVTDALGLRPASLPLTKEQNAASTSTARNGLDLNPGLNGIGGVVVRDEVGTGANDINGGSTPAKSSSSPVSVPPAPAQTLDEHAASMSTSRNSPCLNAISALQPLRLNGGVVSRDEVGVDVSGGSALTSSSQGTFSVPAPPAADPSRTLEKLGGSAPAEDGSSDIDKADPACIRSSTPPVGFSAAPLASPRSNGSIAADDKVAADADNVNSTSDKTSSSVLRPPLLQIQGDNSKLKRTTTNGCLRNRADKPQSTSQPQSADKMKLLENEVKKLEAQLQEAKEAQKETEEHFWQQEYNVLLERLVLREKRVKLQEEAAERVKRLTRSNSHDGVDGIRGCSDHHAAVQAVYGTDVMSELMLPLLQCSKMARTPVPVDNNPSISVRMPPAATSKAEDDVWNKRQTTYALYLGLAVALMFLIRPILPGGIDGWFLAGFALIWGLGSAGFSFGLFGTTRLEKNFSRYIAHLVSLSFSLAVIYAAYLLVFVTSDTGGASPCPPPSSSDIGDRGLVFWRIIFGAIGILVTVGHIVSLAMGYRTGGDRDALP